MPIAQEREYTKKYAGVLGLIVADNAPPFTIWPMRLPQNAVIDDNPDIQKIKGADALGRETTIDIQVNGFDPVMTLTYGGSSTRLLAMQKGRKYEQRTLPSLWTAGQPKQVMRDSYPARPAGKIGFGLAADAPALASAFVNGQVITLVQQPFATFNPATPNSFAVGANFARRFSTDIVAARAFVDFEIFQTNLTLNTISEATLGYHRIRMLVKNSDDTTSYVDIPNALPIPDNSQFNPKADNTEIHFQLVALGACEAYKIYDSVGEVGGVYCDD